MQDLHPNVSSSARALSREEAPTQTGGCPGAVGWEKRDRGAVGWEKNVLGTTCPSCKVKKCEDRRIETAHSQYVCRGKYEHPRAEENSCVPQARGFTL